MGKIKKIMTNSKKKIQIVAYGGAILVVGFCIGKGFEESRTDGFITSLGDNSGVFHKIVDDNLYTLFVIKDQV